MSLIANTVFGPMAPKIEPELLAENVAQFTQNLRHTSGALQPWLLPAAVAGVTMPGTPAVKTIYRYGKDTSSKVNYWFQFPGDVNIVKGAIVTDTEERTYWTDGVYPKKTKSSLAGLTAGTAILPTSLRMGVPPPGWAGFNVALTFTPVASVSGTATDPNSTPLTSTYIITYVTTWGEESQPGNASNVITWRAGQTVTITCPGALSGAYSIDRIRLYRSNTGSNRTTFQQAAERVVATTTHNDTLVQTALGAVCPTFDWAPPTDGMTGLTDMGNGMLAGFEKNTVYFCEPNYPYAWPAKYDTNISAPIVGLAHYNQTLVVGTTDGLVLIDTVDPGNLVQNSPKGAQACVSKRSMVEMLGGVVYASPDGLILVGPSNPSGVNLTKDLFDRDKWQAYVPSSIDGYTIDDRYYAFYDTGSVQACLIFSFGTNPGVVACDQYVTAGYNDERNDALFVVQRVSTTNTLKEWNTGTAMTATWRSKDYRYHSGVCMARAKVTAAAYPVTFTIYYDGVAQTPLTVANGLPFAVQAGRAYTVSYKIDATVKITSVRVATSVKELGDAGG